ncbi:DUF3987 domain-containing protein [Maribacter sp. SA7]|uniref:DUF3987 domain-containing protein n=1 Tax=Maribacter zhoushanensis TaxID=3030012 RepID=UPI0023EC6C51|nr:DUF3987 domain-containing protein [Maribacter zhoushanensis]MDF4201818.1 DUF3987 domain-containing protein [Maribacter zhoushanensis]
MESRKINKEKENALKQLNRILNKLPNETKEFIIQAFTDKRIPKEYLLSSILFAYSNAAGLAFNLKQGGYTNYGNLYFALIGSRGDSKSPAMSLATEVLNNSDHQAYEEFERKKKEISADTLTSSEEEIVERKQHFVQNSTIEAAMFAHSKNPYSLGVFVDEFVFLIEKIANKNNSEGSQWNSFLLQGFTNQHIDISRKTTDSYRMKTSYPTLLGSIQTQLLPKLFANGNLESGLVDRILFTPRLTTNNKLSKSGIPEKTIICYNASLQNLLHYRKSIEESKTSLPLILSTDAQEMLHDYVQNLIIKQQNLPSIHKEYNSKMQINIYKLSIVLHLILNSSNRSFQDQVTVETIDLAICINEFYFTNFKLITSSKVNVIDEKIFNEVLIKKAIHNGATQTDIIALTKKSKGQVSKLWNKYLNEMEEKLETGNQI